uniref:NADH dehydrogenase subunit 3 n=1 Tax=Tessaromerus quadriarticulatus TaxID=3020145 RepID=UPI0024111061|nr:NADH dehydrogenase subunit 3 [Tessaromerus quadriarticulatus]WEM32419.1 NADH dehydrogenase subunit 3 [Tessaromerus quadriarticulatus]
MLLMSFVTLMSMTISISLMVMCTIISKKMESDHEKMSPFECGFNPMNSARTPFSIQFFMIAVLFLIFDIEITIILPVILMIKWVSLYKWMMTIMMFLMVLILGLYHEWMNGELEWK